MEEIKQLFSVHLDINNRNPNESGQILFDRFCSSTDILFEFIQSDDQYRRTAIVILKRILDVRFFEMNETERQQVFFFLTNVLIPIILPLDHQYLSPIVSEIFYYVSHEMDIDSASLMNYIKGLTNPSYFSFVILFLNRLDPSFLDLEFTSNIMKMALESNDKILYELCFRLFVILCNNFPSSQVLQIFIQKLVVLSVNLQSSHIWYILYELSKPFSIPFIEPAMTILFSDSEEIEFKLRVAVFYFIGINFDNSQLPNLPKYMNYLIDFQLTNLNDYEIIDISLFILYQNTLEIAEIRSQAFEVFKSATFQLLAVSNGLHNVVGLYSLAYLIDNAPEMSLIDSIPKDLSVFHPFLISGNSKMVEACFEALKIMIGKPLASHFNFEPIFQDVVQLFLIADDNVRNRAAVFSYEYLHSNFVVTFWIFGKFIQVLHLVKYPELPIYLEILADSILPNSLTVTDNDIDSLVSISSEILRSPNRDLDVKIAAASLCCSLIRKDADLTFKIAEVAITSAFFALKEPSRMMRETMSTCLVRFIKCTFGRFNAQLRPYFPNVLNCSVVQNSLSHCGEPLLATEMIKWDNDLPNKDSFLAFLMTTVQNPVNEKQYKIAAQCLKKVMYKFPVNTQIQITVHIAEIIFSPSYIKLIKFSILMLNSMLKLKNPEENRVQIAQIVSQVLRPFPEEILKPYIGSLCRLSSLVIRSIGPNTPENLRLFCKQLFQKTMESPLFYSHYTFFLFSDCIRCNVVDDEAANSILDGAFNLMKGEYCTNLDSSCSLLCIKAAIEKDPLVLDSEKMAVLVENWIKISNDYSMILSKSYMANVLIILGVKNLIPDDLLITAIQSFPMEVRMLTKEVCQIFLENFQNIATIAASKPSTYRQVASEVVKGVIRLLSAGKSIRYDHKIEAETAVSLIKLVLNLATAIGMDLNGAITECLPGSPRKQATVAEFFLTVQSSQ